MGRTLVTLRGMARGRGIFFSSISLLVLLSCSRLAHAAPPPGRVDYTLSIPEPTSRYVDVEILVDDAPAKRTQLAMPAWTPGSYLIRDFGKHVYEVEAQALDATGACGVAIAVERDDKQTWTVDNQKRGFCLRYRVFADALSVRTSYVDDRFALLNGTSVFMYVVGETERPAELALELPEGWPVHTALRSDSSEGRPRWSASSYDELADSPLLLGEAEVERFEVAGKPLEFVYLAPSGSNADVGRMARDAEAVVRSYARILGGLPFDHYSFLMVGDAAGGGGLEHRDSTAMIIDPWIFSSAGGYARAQRLVAHEFFHLWNVKRIHDRPLGPFDYARETYTDLLWFHEGLTETMEARSLLRAGVTSPERYLEQLQNNWNAYLAKPGRNHTPIAALSREAWIKSYQPEANHSETVVSYYEKGNLIGVCLDLAIRLRARGNRAGGSLDGLFRRLWAGRDPSTGDASIDIDDIVAAASAEAGEDMCWFFDRYVYGVEELPLPELLEQAGFMIDTRDWVGRSAVWSGIRGYGEVSAVAPDSPASAAGVMHGDEIIAVNGSRVDSIREVEERLADLGVGAKATLSLFRRDRLVELELTTAAKPQPWIAFEMPPPDVDDLELAQLRDEWLYAYLDQPQL